MHKPDKDSEKLESKASDWLCVFVISLREFSFSFVLINKHVS